MIHLLFSFPGLWSGGLILCSCCCYCCKITCKSVNTLLVRKCGLCRGCKTALVFLERVLFRRFSPIAGQRPLPGGVGRRGGNNAKPLQSMSGMGFAGGCRGRGPVTPAFRRSCSEMYRPVCKSVEISASLSPSLANLFRVGLLRGFGSGRGWISRSPVSFFFPRRFFGLRGAAAARCGGEQGEGALRAAMAFPGRCN